MHRLTTADVPTCATHTARAALRLKETEQFHILKICSATVNPQIVSRMNSRLIIFGFAPSSFSPLLFLHKLFNVAARSAAHVYLSKVNRFTLVSRFS